jgi:hypothetical protein
MSWEAAPPQLHADVIVAADVLYDPGSLTLPSLLLENKQCCNFVLLVLFRLAPTYNV